MRGWDPLAGLPPGARWGVLGVAGFLVALLIGTGVWALVQHRERAARRAFVAVSLSYRQAVASADESQLDVAARALTQFLRDYPRTPDAPQAWYFLGNLEDQRRHFDAALTAFGEAARRDGGTVGALSRLGIGYAWEAKGEPQRALDAYAEALKGRGPKDFLYDELLLGTARLQEQLKQPGAAIESYRRLLREAPESARAEEARTRLAILGASA